MWACYTVAMRKARLEGLHAAAIAAVASLITYVPVYAIIFGTGLFNAPWRDIALQAFVHGLLTAVISLMLYGRAVSILGASNGSAFAALAPVMTAILAIPILGEWPMTSDWIAMLLISGGVYIASGGLLPVRRVGHTFSFGCGNYRDKANGEPAYAQGQRCLLSPSHLTERSLIEQCQSDKTQIDDGAMDLPAYYIVRACGIKSQIDRRCQERWTRD